jgi:hypothetical protein
MMAKKKSSNRSHENKNPETLQGKPSGKSEGVSPAVIAMIMETFQKHGIDLAEEDARGMGESMLEIAGSLGLPLDESTLIAFFEQQLGSILAQVESSDNDENLNLFDEDEDEEDEDSDFQDEEFDEEPELNEWEKFASENFHTDLFNGAEALEVLELSPDRTKRYKQISKIAKQYPKHGRVWIQLASLESDQSAARDQLQKALSNAQWVLDLAKQFPEHALALRRYYVMLGLDAAGEFWLQGMRTDSLELHENLLTILDDDTGGQRMLYAYRLLEQGWVDELDEQIAALEKSTQSQAGLSLLKAFAHYSRGQDLKAAADALKESHDHNPMTFDTLLGNVQNDDLDYSDQHSPEVEADWLGRLAMAPAASISGLNRWMRDTLDYTPPEMDEDDEEDSWEDRMGDIADLPQSDAIWFVESRSLHNGFVSVVGEADEGDILAFDHFDEMPNENELWEMVLDAIEFPDSEEPERPKKLIVSATALETAWQSRCDELDIELSFDDELDVPDEMFEYVAKGLSVADANIDLDEATLTELADLPQSEETWVVGSFHAPLWIEDTATPRRPWIHIVMESDAGMIRMQELLDDEPAQDSMAKTIAKAMRNSMVPGSESMRPTAIQFHSSVKKASLEDLCERLDVRLEPAEDGEMLESVIESLVKMASPPDLDEGMDESANLSELEFLYRDLALFYRAALWRSVPRDSYLEIEVLGSKTKKFFAKLVGQVGEYRGLFVCDKVETLRDQVDGDDDEELSLDSATILSYDEDYKISPVDLWNIERYSFEVAGENAYPVIQFSDRSQDFRRPSREEVLDVQIAIRCFMALAEVPPSEMAVEKSLSVFEGITKVAVKWAQI